MNDNNNGSNEPPNRNADLQALSEAINLAPLGVLSRRTIAQLISLRDRLAASASTPSQP